LRNLVGGFIASGARIGGFSSRKKRKQLLPPSTQQELWPNKALQRTRTSRAAELVCAGHGTELARCKSSRQVFAEPKARRMARASPRGGVCRKPNPKLRGDEQEPDKRCGALGASRHVTTKSSIRNRGVLYKSGVYAGKVLCLSPGDLPFATDRRVRGKLAEGVVMLLDQRGEVSRGYSRSSDRSPERFPREGMKRVEGSRREESE